MGTSAKTFSERTVARSERRRIVLPGLMMAGTSGKDGSGGAYLG